MTAIAGATGKCDVGSRVDGQAVVLVLDISSRDVDTSGGPNVKGIGVVTAFSVTQRVVDRDTINAQVVHTVDAESLNWGVDHMEVLDQRV